MDLDLRSMNIFVEVCCTVLNNLQCKNVKNKHINRVNFKCIKIIPKRYYSCFGSFFPVWVGDFSFHRDGRIYPRIEIYQNYSEKELTHVCFLHFQTEWLAEFFFYLDRRIFPWINSVLLIWILALICLSTFLWIQQHQSLHMFWSWSSSSLPILCNWNSLKCLEFNLIKVDLGGISLSSWIKKMEGGK